jgi:hypothetical protein
VFFAYIGFDAVSTAAQETKNPQRDMPIGIIGSLVVCTILYIIVAMVLTGLVSYKALNVGDPIVVGIQATGHAWGTMLVEFGAVCGLGTTMLVMLFGQSRVFFSMGRDGLVWPWASKVHPKTRTPWISNIVFGLIAGIMPALLPVGKLAELVNMGTLLAFAIVCAGVWILRVRHPEMHRPFKCPWVPVVPILGIITSLYLVWTLPLLTKEVVFGWLLVGLVIYFTYSVRHSKVQQAIADPAIADSKTSMNKAAWIVGAIVVVLLLGYLTATLTSGKLTTRRAQQAVSQWSGGGINVTGVREIPQENAASAVLYFSSFNIRQDGLFGQTSTRTYSGPGEATFVHYTDGRWVLVKVVTSEGLNSVWWDNLNIQVH